MGAVELTLEPSASSTGAPPVSPAISIASDDFARMMERLRHLEAAQAAHTAKESQATQLAAQQAAEDAASDRMDDAGSGKLYADTDRVIVLHGYGRVEPTRVEWKLGRSKGLYKSEGGLVRDVLYDDARHWREQWGRRFVKILPLTATEADFAKATGIQPMNLGKLAAMNEAVAVDALVEAWGAERALRFAERLTTYIASKQPHTNAG
jgi:hypothetical protein